MEGASRSPNTGATSATSDNNDISPNPGAGSATSDNNDISPNPGAGSATSDNNDRSRKEWEFELSSREVQLKVLNTATTAPFPKASSQYVSQSSVAGSLKQLDPCDPDYLALSVGLVVHFVRPSDVLVVTSDLRRRRLVASSRRHLPKMSRFAPSVRPQVHKCSHRSSGPVRRRNLPQYFT